MTYSRGRIDRGNCTCRRCKRFRQHAARGLCNSCYAIERKGGRLDQWTLVGLGQYERQPVPAAGPPTPAPDCAWCGAPLTRSRTRFGESLYEVFTVAGMIHRDSVQRHGDEFYAEALRRLFRAGEHPRAAQLPYETIGAETGLMTIAEHEHNLEGHRVIDRLNAERAKQEAREAREETHRVFRDAARDLAKLLRDWTNERTVPAKLRREGVLLAADWIDPDTAASPYRRST